MTSNATEGRGILGRSEWPYGDQTVIVYENLTVPPDLLWAYGVGEQHSSPPIANWRPKSVSDPGS